MKYDHEIISDILPLYVNGVCSEQSAAAVQDHLTECQKCRAAFKAMEANAASSAKKLNDSTDMQQLSRKVSVKVVATIIGIIFIILYWIIRALMKSYADVGDYRHFLYHFWEGWNFGYIIIPIFTGVWLCVEIWKATHTHLAHTKRIIAMILLLSSLFAAQIGIIYFETLQVGTVGTGWIEDVQSGQFTFDNGSDKIEISCSYEITPLLKSDGTVYVVNFKWNRLSPNHGVLTQIEEAGYNRSSAQ